MQRQAARMCLKRNGICWKLQISGIKSFLRNCNYTFVVVIMSCNFSALLQWLCSEAYSEPCQTPKKKRSVKIVNEF